MSCYLLELHLAPYTGYVTNQTRENLNHKIHSKVWSNLGELIGNSEDLGYSWVTFYILIDVSLHNWVWLPFFVAEKWRHWWSPSDSASPSVIMRPRMKDVIVEISIPLPELGLLSKYLIWQLDALTPLS